jgi:nucleoid-associated protein YgaU
VSSPPPEPAQGQAPASASHAILSEVQSVTVQRGDSLWRISQRLLGSGYRYTQIYAANSNQIRDPSLIYPEQILVIPAGAKPN